MARPVPVIIPTYHRPHRIEKLISEVRAAGGEPFFVVHELDTETLELMFRLTEPTPVRSRIENWQWVKMTGESSGVAATNYGWKRLIMRRDENGHPIVQPWPVTPGKGSASEWAVIAQDDVSFHPDCLVLAARAASVTGARVIGFNDLLGGRAAAQHSVCWMVKVQWVEEVGLADGEWGTVFHSGYHKNYADNELCQLAKFRNVWAYAEDAVIAHEHPAAGAAGDATHGRGEAHAEKDRQLYLKRSMNFGGPQWL